MPEQTHQEEQRDEAFMARLNELLEEMKTNGFIEYVDKKTGGKVKLTFSNVISESCDEEGFFPAMFEFYSAFKGQRGLDLLQTLDTVHGLNNAIEQLLISYIAYGVIPFESGG